MPYTEVFFTSQAHIGRIVISNPGSNNAINERMAVEIRGICERINQKNNIYVVIVTGAGEVFSAGSSPELSNGCANAIANIECATIAAINGDAIGQGLEIALGCDIRIAANNAMLSIPQVTAGTIPDDGGTQRLPRIVGKGKALELLLTAATLSAEEALETGLVSKVVASGELDSEVQSLAETIAAKGPIAVKYLKEAVNKGMDMTLEQGLRLEADLYFLLHTTADRTEGVQAFREKRTPDFKGE